MSSESSDREEQGGRKLDGLQDFMRRTISSGVRGVLTTEEGIRNLVAELFPKELGSYVRAQIESMRDEVSGAVIREFTNFLKNLDLAGDIRKNLSGLKINVKAEITISEADDEPGIAGGVKAGPKRKPAKPKAPVEP